MFQDNEFTTVLAAEYVRGKHDKYCSPFQLAKLRSRGKGPLWLKRDGRIVYRQSDLDRWATTAQPRLDGPLSKHCDEFAAPLPAAVA